MTHGGGGCNVRAVIVYLHQLDLQFSQLKFKLRDSLTRHNGAKVFLKSDSNIEGKEIVERRHGEPIIFLFLPKMVDSSA